MALLPPLETLRVFEVACRHGSYSEAARELHVTHSAVSQRIRQLEEDLGLTLFERQGNRMVPTSSGLRLQAGVKSAFSELGAALSSIETRRTDAEITVSLLPVMAARWLVPRLPRFKARFPRINLHVKTGQSLSISRRTASTSQSGSGRAIGKDCGQSSFSMKSFSRYAVPASTRAAFQKIPH
jgi:LysR family glycine cleavage system transcriptional activator